MRCNSFSAATPIVLGANSSLSAILGSSITAEAARQLCRVVPGAFEECGVELRYELVVDERLSDDSFFANITECSLVGISGHKQDGEGGGQALALSVR